MEKSRKRSRHHLERETSPIKERERSVIWEDHRSSLDELFFRDCDLIKRFVNYSCKISNHHFFHHNLIFAETLLSLKRLIFIRGSQDYKDFWLFLERYEAFHNKRHVEKHPRGEIMHPCTLGNFVKTIVENEDPLKAKTIAKN